MTEVTQSGYVRQANGTYIRQSLPPLEFEYSKAVISSAIETVDPESAGPVGSNGHAYRHDPRS